MKRKHLVATIIGGLAIFGFCFSGGSAQLSTVKKPLNPVPHAKTGVKAPSHPHSQPRHLHSKKPIKRLPDLVVEKIWLNRGYISFSLKNGGKGAIPDKEHKNGKVAIICGKKTQTYALTGKVGGNAPVDPSGILKKPGKFLSFTTHIKPAAGSKTSLISVRVFVDSTGKIQEQNEGNNTKTGSLHVTPKRAAAVKTGKFARGKTGKPTKRSAQQPELSVEGIYLKNGRVHVSLRSHGIINLTAGKLRPVTLNLVTGGKVRAWHLAAIDREGHLRHPHGSLDFNTGVVLSKTQWVTVYVNGLTCLKKSVRLAFSTPLASVSKKALKPIGGSSGKPGDSRHPRKLPVAQVAPRQLGAPGPLDKNLHPAAVPPRELLALDIKIRDNASGKPLVEYDYLHNRIWIYYDCDPNKYRGPVEFRIILRDPYSLDLVMDKTWIDPESADLMASVAFNWEDAFPHSYKPLKLRYEIWVNPGNKILETNYENNQRFGDLYHGGAPFISRVSSPFLPELENQPRPESITRTQWWVRNAVLDGKCYAYYDPPDTNVLMIKVTVTIENPASANRTVHVIFSCDGRDGLIKHPQDVVVAPAGWTEVTMRMDINLQDENYIQISSSTGDFIYIHLNFPGLPYDPTAPLDH